MIKRWNTEECRDCRYEECCEGLDALRKPVMVAGTIVGYEDECSYREVME